MSDQAMKIMNKKTRRIVMLAVDHGYFQGPTSGLEEPGKTMEHLMPYCDAVSPTKGVFLRCMPTEGKTPVILRASGGNAIVYSDPVELERELSIRMAGVENETAREALREQIADDIVNRELSNESITVSAAEAARLGVAGVSVSIYVGARYQKESIVNLALMSEEGRREGLLVLGITAVGKEMTRDARYLGLATRIAAEHGADVVKTYFCEGFERVVRGCFVPIIIAGGKKVHEREALMFCRRAMDEGAVGVDMGRNIFQSTHPVAMIQAVCAVVHDDLVPDAAYEMFRDLSAASLTA